MSGKSVKGKTGSGRGKGPKRPTRSVTNSPSGLFDTICWFEVEDDLLAVNQGSRRLKGGKVVDWSKLGGYFEDTDIIILKFSDYGAGVPDYVFEWKNIVGIYSKLRGDVSLARLVSQYTTKPNAQSLSGVGSPHPCFELNLNDSVLSQGVFVFDLDAGLVSQKPSGGGAPTRPAPEGKVDVESMDTKELEALKKMVEAELKKKKK